MKNKILLAIILLCTSTISVAESTSIISKLKRTPLTAYDSAKFKLESLTLIWGLMEEEKRSSKKLSFNIIEKNQMLGLEVLMNIKAKEMSDENCSKGINEFAKKLVNPTKIPKILWPQLNEKEQISVLDELFVRLTLTAKENNSFNLSCEKKLSQISN